MRVLGGGEVVYSPLYFFFIFLLYIHRHMPPLIFHRHMPPHIFHRHMPPLMFLPHMPSPYFSGMRHPVVMAGQQGT